MGGNTGSFFGGLLNSLGDTLLNKEQQQYQAKMKDNEARQRALELISQSPDIYPDQQALIQKAMLAPTLQGMDGGIGGLLKKGGKKGGQQPSKSDLINQLHDS